MALAIAPSIQSVDLSRLKDEMQAHEAAATHWLHFDVMDGHCVGNIRDRTSSGQIDSQSHEESVGGSYGKTIHRRRQALGQVSTCCFLTSVCYLGRVGAWLSLVERTVRDREVGGSNPLAPTKLPLPCAGLSRLTLYPNLQVSSNETFRKRLREG